MHQYIKILSVCACVRASRKWTFRGRD